MSQTRQTFQTSTPFLYSMERSFSALIVKLHLQLVVSKSLSDQIRKNGADILIGNPPAKGDTAVEETLY
jgi:hypothetical protein